MAPINQAYGSIVPTFKWRHLDSTRLQLDTRLLMSRGWTRVERVARTLVTRFLHTAVLKPHVFIVRLCSNHSENKLCAPEGRASPLLFVSSKRERRATTNAISVRLWKLELTFSCTGTYAVESILLEYASENKTENVTGVITLVTQKNGAARSSMSSDIYYSEVKCQGISLELW